MNPNNGHIYYLLSQATWTDSEAKAVQLGGHLVTINDQAEEDWVYSQFASFGGVDRNLWIGLNDAASEGTFVWASGAPLTYTHWSPLEPNSGQGHIDEDYVHIFLPSIPRGGLWNDGVNDGIAAMPSWAWHGVVEATGARVANDECTGAIVLTEGVTNTMSTANATSTGDEGYSKGVWFTYTPSFSGLVLVRTCGSSFDTALGVFEGPCDALNPVVGAPVYEDAAICGGRNDIATFIGEAGTTYSIVAGGADEFTSGTLRITARNSAVGGPTPPQPVYPSVLSRQPGKDSLVFITHGTTITDLEQSWIESMSNSIASNAPANWQVVGYRWTARAFLTPVALYEGQQVGRSVGREIGRTNWNHVHLIAHSAGSALIQAASEEIKSLRPSTVVHTTFLDAYEGPFYGGASKYGDGSDWADSYFSTGDFRYTQAALDHAYNVNVTWLDSRTHPVSAYISSPFPGSTAPVAYGCDDRYSTHTWPIDFYQGTITNSGNSAYEGLGFPVSKEGGGWPGATNNRVGNVQPRVLGGQQCVVSSSPLPTATGAPLLLASMPQVRSSSGTIAVSGAGFTASSGSPVWILFNLPVANAVNFVAFDAAFTSSSGAEGLLSAYWDTNSIGMLDERFAATGLQHYTFDLPAASTNGEHLLGFQLDTYTNVTSSILVTNVVLGFVGFTQSFSLAVTATITNGLRVFRLSGPAGYSYMVEASTNLIDWTPAATLVNTNGSVNFLDSAATNLNQRFYRALSP